MHRLLAVPSTLLDVIDAVLRSRDRGDPQRLRRMRTVLGIAASLPPLFAAFVALDPPILHGPNRTLFLTLYACAVPVLLGCCSIALLLDRLRLAVNLGMAYFAVFLTLLVYHTGGPLSGSAIWLVAVPVTAALALGRNAALGWLAVALAVLVGIHVLHVRGAPFEGYGRADLIDVWHWNLHGLTCFILAGAFACERARARASETLQHAHLELAHARDRADAANRARGTFVASMSHELRTPMNAVLGFAELALEQHESQRGDPDDAGALRTIARSARGLLKVLDDILDLSDIETQRLEIHVGRVPVRAHLEQVIALMHRQASLKGTSLVLELCEPLPEAIDTDPVRLQQILVNLVANAIKFSFEGEVRIRVHTTRAGPVERLRIEVSDSGIGMTAEQVERLFQPFAQADPSTTRLYGGTGLGLSISRRLAERLGATIGVKSAPGTGSTFHVELPLERDPGAAPAPADASPKRRCPALDARVLVVDDTLDNRRLAQHILERAGARVDTAASGEEALARVSELQRSAQGYDVILMDIQMPHMDGYAALRGLRALGCTVPVVAFTAHAMTSEREHALAAGFVRHAAKPLARDALIRLVAEVAGAPGEASRTPQGEVAFVRTVRPQLRERLARALLAPELRSSPEAIREARAAIGMATAGLAVLAPLAALASWILPHGVAAPLSALILGLAPVIVGALCLDRAFRSRRPSSHLVCLYLIGIIAVITHLSGGAGSPITAWGLLAPMIALALLGTRSGLVWAAIFALTTQGFYGAAQAGIALPDHIGPQDWPLAATASTSVLAGVASVFGLIYERAKSEAIEGLTAANAGLRQARAQAERSEHAKTEFLASISHELRTPMTAMLGFA